jgi:hypothetical protein
MLSSGMLHRVALVRTDVLDERIVSITGETRISELGKTLTVTSNRSMLRRNMSILTRATYHDIPEDSILHSEHCENLKSYILHCSCSMGAIFEMLDV